MSDPRIRSDAARALRRAIQEVDGDEVFAIGAVEDGVIVSVEVTCRGTKDRVPALLGRPKAGQVVIHNHPSGNLQPSDADLFLAGKYGEAGVGVVIIDNTAARSRWVVEPHDPKPTPVDKDTVRRFFTEVMPRVMPGHEPRPAQIEMALAVTDALVDGRVAVLEAGTGTGKSLAYLVPAALWAKANDSKVVVATHTLTLQGQLATSDLPVLDKARLGVRWTTLRGRSNYLCRRKLIDAATEVGLDADALWGEDGPRSGQTSLDFDTDDDASPDYDEAERRRVLDGLLRAAIAGEGNRQALAFPVQGDVWDDVRSDHDQTLRARCPHFDRCFYYQARRKAADAHLLVVNHHLVLADLTIKAESGGDGVLPKFDRLIIDEGHHLEDAATSLLRGQLTAPAITRAVARLVGGRRRKGTLHRLHKRFGSNQSPLGEVERDHFVRNTAHLLAALPRLADAANTVLEGIANAALTSDDGTQRLTPTYRKTDTWQATIAPELQTLSGGLGQAARRLDRLADLLDALTPQARLADPQPVFELGRAQRLFGQHARLAGTFTQTGAEGAPEGVVQWMERARNKSGPPKAALVSAPLEVGPLLRERLFDPLAATVVTSATLAVRGSFDHYRSRVGLGRVGPKGPGDGEDEALDSLLDEILGELGHTPAESTGPPIHTALFPSPFDYASQAVLGLPRDLPTPDHARWAPLAARATTAALHIARGGVFVLCTSFAMVDQLHHHAQQALGDRMLLLKQGEMGRSRLLARFRDAGDAVLFGTDSFWEGVSIKGSALRLVVIPKLPFRVPTEPVQQARSELMQSRGLDPFRAQMLPEAVLKLRQGFGRLIRTQADRGAVLILDRRVLDRWYGRVFLGSLPPARRVTGPTRAVLQQVRDFLRAEVPAARP